MRERRGADEIPGAAGGGDEGVEHTPDGNQASDRFRRADSEWSVGAHKLT